MIKHLFRRFKKNSRGVAAVEFAIILPFLLVLVIGVIDLGWLFNGWVVLTGAAREGARTAITDPEQAVEAALDHAVNFRGSVSEPEVLKDEEKVTVIVSGRLDPLVGWFGNEVSAQAEVRRYYPKD